MRPADRPSGLDGGALLALADRRDLDLAGTRLLSHRDGEAEHAGVIGRLDSVEVQVVTQHQLATEGALAAFGGEHLPVAVARRPLGAAGQHVALDAQVDGVDVHSGTVELETDSRHYTPG